MISMVVWTRGDDDDDDGGDGDRELDGSNGSSSVCVGGTGCTTLQPAHPPLLLNDHYDGHQPIFNCCQQGFKDLH